MHCHRSAMMVGGTKTSDATGQDLFLSISRERERGHNVSYPNGSASVSRNSRYPCRYQYLGYCFIAILKCFTHKSNVHFKKLPVIETLRILCHHGHQQWAPFWLSSKEFGLPIKSDWRRSFLYPSRSSSFLTKPANVIAKMVLKFGFKYIGKRG